MKLILLSKVFGVLTAFLMLLVIFIAGTCEADVVLEIITFNKPLFLYGLEGADWVLPKIEKNGPTIGLLPLTHIRDHKDDDYGAQRETIEGMLSRSIMVYLMESLYFQSNANPVFVLPVLPNVGTVMCDEEWPVDLFLRKFENSKKFDYFVSGTLQRVGGDDGVITLNIWDCTSGLRKEKTITVDFQIDKIGQPIIELKNMVFGEFAKKGFRIDVKPHNEFMITDPKQLDLLLLVYSQGIVTTLASNWVIDRQTIVGVDNILLNPLILSEEDKAKLTPRYSFLAGLVRNYIYGGTEYMKYEESAFRMVNDFKDERMGRLKPIVYYIYGKTDKYLAEISGSKKIGKGYYEWVLKLNELKSMRERSGSLTEASLEPDPET